MKKIIRSRLLQKMLILAVLFGGLAFVISSNNNTSVNAARCCSECDEIAEWCSNNSGGPNDPYKTVDECEAARGVMGCYSTCIICGDSEPRYCEFTTQCHPGEFCIDGVCQTN